MNRTSVFGLARIVCPILFITLSLASCKKEEDPQPEPVNPPASTAYSFPLTDGSYWVYLHELTDSNGTVTQTGSTDSVYVDGDTVIGSHTYKKIRTVRNPAGSYWIPSEALAIVRDSAGYIVNITGAFVEHDNFSDTLHYADYSGAVNAWYFMKHEDSLVTVPAGTFSTIDYEGHMYATDPNYLWAVPRYTHQLYADGVGKVREILYFYSSPGYVQRSLVSYHIN